MVGPVWHRARALSHLRLTAEQQNKKITPQFLIRYKPYFAVRLHQPLLKMFTSTVIARCCIQIDCNNTGTVGTFQEAGVTLHWFAFFSSFLRDAMKKTPNTSRVYNRIKENIFCTTNIFLGWSTFKAIFTSKYVTFNDDRKIIFDHSWRDDEHSHFGRRAHSSQLGTANENC